MSHQNFKHLASILRDAIQQEAEALLDFSASIPDAMCKAVEMVHSKQKSSRLVCTGMGKSGHIASKVCATLISTGTPSQFLHPAEALHGDLGMILSNDIILAFSNSGETEEIVRILPFFKHNSNPVICVVGNSDSTLANSSDICISYDIKREACPHNLAPTSSTTLSLAIGDALAIGLMADRKFTPIDFARYHPGGSVGRMLITTVADIMRTPPPIVEMHQVLTEVIHRIITGKAGMVIVVNTSNDLVGIVTSGDIQRAFTLYHENFLMLRASDIMTKSPITIHQSAMLSEAVSALKGKPISGLVVKDDQGKPVGILTSTDIF
jgi:arabinose-5-phosphate isomerase